MKKMLSIFVGVILMTFIGCSSTLQEYSPDQVISNALNEKNTSHVYYAESTVTMKEKGKTTETLTMKEWVNKDGKRRVETKGEDERDHSIAVNDGTRITTYIPAEKKAFVIEDEELLALNQRSPKEQAEQMLKLVQDTHDIDIVGEEKVAGRTTIHLKAKANSDKALIGDQEFWIDKENWLTLKSKSSSGESNVEWVYTKIEFDAKMSDELFTLELPDDVEIENIEEMLEPNEISLEEARVALEQSFLYLRDEAGLQLTKVELTELTGELARKEISLNYDRDGLPFLTLGIFPTPDDLDDELDISLPNEEEVTVREQKGLWLDGDFRHLHWKEEGLTYSLIVTDPDVGLSELLKMLENMVHFD